MKIKGEAISEVGGDKESEADGRQWDRIISEMNSRTNGCVYQLPGYEVSGIKKKMSDFASKPEDDDA